ncbi:energy transducer TonB [Winogradskyella sp. PC D3.3]
MKYKLLVVITLIVTLSTTAQNLNDESIMGEWVTINVEIPNPENARQKEASKLMTDAFLGSKFNFKGNKVFKITYGKTTDARVKELFFLDNQNWIIENDQIKIGMNNDYSSMHIMFQEINGKTYFLLPMMRLEMEKISNDTPSKPKLITSKKEIIEPVDYSKSELVLKEIDASQIIEYSLVENPPLAPDCKAKWSLEKRQECTRNYINRFVSRKFNTDLAAEVKVTGKIKINIEFVIDTNGKPVNITATGGPEIMNQNAKDVIGLLPDLAPGTQNENPVNVLYKMPLIFHIVD